MARRSPEPRTALGTPVLSARRLPALLRRELADRRLRTRVDSALGDPAYGSSASQSCVLIGQGGRLIHALRADAQLIPASNLKILTAFAALEVLGPDYRFVTEIKAERPAADGVIEGDAWLVGGGDPVIMTAEYASSVRYQPQLVHSVDAVAAALTDAGIREIRGDFLGDHSRYDDVHYLPTWRSTYRSAGEVGPIDALVVNDGFASYTPSRVAASDPAVHAAGMVAAAAERRGVVLGLVGSGTAPEGAVTIARAESPPLSEIVDALLTTSDNTTAEMLLKELGVARGAGGTTEAGLAAMGDVLQRIGLDPSGIVLRDGSGLDRGNRVSCSVVDRALTHDGAAGIRDGLAVAAQSGTLADRFIGTPAAGRLRAKTGALAGVASLSGAVAPAEGEPLNFAFIANGLPSESAGRGLQQRLGVALALYPEAPTLAELSPRG